MATTTPSDEELSSAVSELRSSHPDLGILKLLAQLKTHHPTWAVSEKRFRKVLQGGAGSAQATANGGHAGDVHKVGSQAAGAVDDKSATSVLVADTGLDPTIDTAKIAPKIKVKMFKGGKGKGLVAREKILMGELVWSEEPWIVTADSNLYSPLLSQQMCTQCYTYFSRPAPPLSVPCPYCPLAHFCNRLCLSKARSSASHHELLCPSQNPGCKELLEYINQQGNRPVEAVARIVAKWRGEREWSGEGEAKKVEERVWKGMARVNQEKKESERKEWHIIAELRKREWHHAHHLLCIALNPPTTAHEYKNFQRILRKNAKSGRPLVPLSDEEEKTWFSFESFLELLGLVGVNQEDSGGLYALHAHLNHSCEPNLQTRNLPKSYVHPPPPTELPGRFSQRGTTRLSMLARRVIHPGEELTISYVNIAMPRNERRRALREIYGFWCNCPRCEKEKGMVVPDGHEEGHVHGLGCGHEDGYDHRAGPHEPTIEVEDRHHQHGPGCNHGHSHDDVGATDHPSNGTGDAAFSADEGSNEKQTTSTS